MFEAKLKTSELGRDQMKLTNVEKNLIIFDIINSEWEPATFLSDFYSIYYEFLLIKFFSYQNQKYLYEFIRQKISLTSCENANTKIWSKKSDRWNR